MYNKSTDYISLNTEAMQNLKNYDIHQDEASIKFSDDLDIGNCNELGQDLGKHKTVLPAHTTINGNINSKDSIQLDGRLNGNIKTSEDFSANGVVVGDITSTNVKLGNAKAFGNTNSDGCVELLQGSIVVGKIKAHDVSIDGKLKGSLEVEDTATFLQNAVVVADIKTGKINVDSSAKLNANITLISDKRTAVSDDEFNMDLGDK